jgi:hypothetical protein
VLSLPVRVYTLPELEAIPCQAFQGVYHNAFLLTFSLLEDEDIGNNGGINPVVASRPYHQNRNIGGDRCVASLPWLHYRFLTDVVLPLGFQPRSPWVPSPPRIALSYYR